jgi:hypothetical protein
MIKVVHIDKRKSDQISILRHGVHAIDEYIFQYPELN